MTKHGDSKPRLVIFAGAHKTASSHLQHSLLGSAPALQDLGIAVIGPKTMRQDLTPFSQLLRDGMTPDIIRAGATGFLHHYGGNADTVALMDENILGGTDRKMLMRKTRLYPWAPRRVARLLELFADYNVEIALATRNPATFLPSCWSESLHHGRFEDFERFTQGFDPSVKLWTGVASRIAETCPGLRMNIWRYEDYTTFGASLFGRLLKPQAGTAVRLDPIVRRAGLSQKAAEWFQAQTRQDKNTVQEARQRFPKTGPETSFCPWTENEYRTLSMCYDRDIDRLASLESVTLLKPAHGPDA